MGDTRHMTSNGWTYDQAAQAWTAKVGPSRWLIVKGDLDDAPTFRPQAIA